MTKLFLKNHILLFLVISSSINLHGGTTPFITTWKTDNLNILSPDQSNVNQITIPTSGGGYNYTVDWGDGTISTNHTGDVTHTYTTIGTYTVSITGDFPRIYFNGSGDGSKILTIEQWGNNEWTSMESAFAGCYNLQGTFVDAPDLSNVTDMSYMFSEANKFNYYIGNWDVSNVANMEFMFFQAHLFNQDIGNWNVSNVTNMGHLFQEAYLFNQNLDNWDVSKVTNMQQMFRETKFNQDISSWDVSNVTQMQYMFNRIDDFNQDIGNWDVSSVINMSSMFVFTSFNQDIGNWDVGNVTDMSAMFASSLFNQDIGSWDVSKVIHMQNMFGNTPFNQDISNWDVSNVTYMHFMFEDSKLSTPNYDALLIGWSNLDLQPNVNLHAGNSLYSCISILARENMIVNYNWRITDDGFVGGLLPPVIDSIDDQIWEGNFILPKIEGLNITSSAKYYTEPDGGGAVYYPSDSINFYDFDSYPVTLYAYESRGGCSSEVSFNLTITSMPLLCARLSTPLSGTQYYVPLDTDLNWSAVEGAIGYKLSVGTSSLSTDIINALDLGNTLTYDFPVDLPPSTQIYVNITPYNLYEESIGCNEENFKTASATIPKYFTPNHDNIHDRWVVPDPSNAISSISIYNRYGKLLKQFTDINKGWDGTYLNKPLPTNDYWYVIQYKEGKVIKGHLSLLR